MIGDLYKHNPKGAILSEPWTNFPVNLLAGFISGAAVFIGGIFVGLFWRLIPKSRRQYRLRQFWGSGVLSDRIAIVYGGFRDSRLYQKDPPKFRFRKEYADGRWVEFTGPHGNVVADAEIRAASYLISAMSIQSNRIIPVQLDSEAFADLSRTIVSLGSGSSNQLTELILREPANTFLAFGQVDGETYIYDKTTLREFRGFQPPVMKDIGLVLKIPNERFPGNYFFACAGLGEWGTSGAAWFLATKWLDLRAEFDSGFGIVVEVEPRSDESARRIFAIPEDSSRRTAGF